MADKTHTIGADEVGYGALCGPLVIGAVRAPKDWAIPGLNDSKKLTEKQRNVMNDKIRVCAVNGDIQLCLAERSNTFIDEHGVAVALRECYKQVADELYTATDLIIIDGNLNFDAVLSGKDYETLVKADSKIPAVMAASIIAKVYRDNMMIKLAEQFPAYDWASNKGYGSSKHIDAIKKQGYSELHRLSYKLK